MEPVQKYYTEKNIEADDEKSIIEIDDDIPGASTENLKDKLTSNIGKTIIKTVTGEGYDKIKINQNLLKKIF